MTLGTGMLRSCFMMKTEMLEGSFNQFGTPDARHECSLVSGLSQTKGTECAGRRDLVRY